MHLLISLLYEIKALGAISGHQLSNENYTVVFDLLKKQFGIIDAQRCVARGFKGFR